jgi:hypothetical protein
VTGNPFDSHDRRRRFDDPDLTRRILDQTSGRACGRAEELLGGRWDGMLAAGDQELLMGHLDRCPACRELSLILDRLQPALPGLAEREPGPAFTARVLARTSRRQPVPNTRYPGRLERLAERLEHGLRRLWQRPRFALEAAWTAATLAALLVWGPLAPADAPDQAANLVRSGSAAVPELVTRVQQLKDSALLVGREVFGPRLDRLEQRVSRLTARAEHLRTEGLALWRSLTGDDGPDDQTDQNRRDDQRPPADE